jgi:hypothetical protein
MRYRAGRTMRSLAARPGRAFFGSSSSLGSGAYEHRVVDKLTTLRMMRGVVMLP